MKIVSLDSALAAIARREALLLRRPPARGGCGTSPRGRRARGAPRRRACAAAGPPRRGSRGRAGRSSRRCRTPARRSSPRRCRARASIATISRRRSSGTTGGEPAGGLCSSIAVSIYRAVKGRGARRPRACIGRHVCATSRSHMFESSALGPDTNVSDHRNDHSGALGDPTARTSGTGSRERRRARRAIALRKEARPPTS